MDFSLLGLWNQMGFIARAVVITLIGMSMFAIGISLERYLTYRKGRQRSLEFIAELQRIVANVTKLKESPKLSAEWEDAPLARIATVGFQEYSQGLKDLSGPKDAVELELLMHSVGRSLERAKKREMAGLSKGLPVLATIASSAPFVGLFGTVFGIITAFQLMADPEAGGGGLATVSAGIAEALLTTAVGLGVAIAAVWFFNYFTTKLEQLGTLMDDATGELVDRLAHGTRRAYTVSVEGEAAQPSANSVAYEAASAE